MNHHNNHHLRPVLMDIARDHRALTHELRDLRRMARGSTGAKPVEREQLAAALAKLRAEMETHFAEEAKGGVLDEAVARLPRLAATAAEIEHEHPELLRQIDAAIRLVSEAGATKPNWAEAQAALEAFAVRMLKHESTENHLLAEGFNEDISALIANGIEVGAEAP